MFQMDFFLKHTGHLDMYLIQKTICPYTCLWYEWLSFKWATEKPPGKGKAVALRFTVKINYPTIEGCEFIEYKNKRMDQPNKRELWILNLNVQNCYGFFTCMKGTLSPPSVHTEKCHLMRGGDAGRLPFIIPAVMEDPHIQTLTYMDSWDRLLTGVKRNLCTHGKNMQTQQTAWKVTIENSIRSSKTVACNDFNPSWFMFLQTF